MIRSSCYEQYSWWTSGPNHQGDFHFISHDYTFIWKEISAAFGWMLKKREQQTINWTEIARLWRASSYLALGKEPESLCYGKPWLGLRSGTYSIWRVLLLRRSSFQVPNHLCKFSFCLRFELLESGLSPQAPSHNQQRGFHTAGTKTKPKEWEQRDVLPPDAVLGGLRNFCTKSEEVSHISLHESAADVQRILYFHVLCLGLRFTFPDQLIVNGQSSFLSFSVNVYLVGKQNILSGLQTDKNRGIFAEEVVNSRALDKRIQAAPLFQKWGKKFLRSDLAVRSTGAWFMRHLLGTDDRMRCLQIVRSIPNLVPSIVVVCLSTGHCHFLVSIVESEVQSSIWQWELNVHLLTGVSAIQDHPVRWPRLEGEEDIRPEKEMKTEP